MHHAFQIEIMKEILIFMGTHSIKHKCFVQNMRPNFWTKNNNLIFCKKLYVESQLLYWFSKENSISLWPLYFLNTQSNELKQCNGI